MSVWNWDETDEQYYRRHLAKWHKDSQLYGTDDGYYRLLQQYSPFDPTSPQRLRADSMFGLRKLLKRLVA